MKQTVNSAQKKAQKCQIQIYHQTELQPIKEARQKRQSEMNQSLKHSLDVLDKRVVVDQSKSQQDITVEVKKTKLTLQDRLQECYLRIKEFPYLADEQVGILKVIILDAHRSEKDVPINTLVYFMLNILNVVNVPYCISEIIFDNLANVQIKKLPVK